MDATLREVLDGLQTNRCCAKRCNDKAIKIWDSVLVRFVEQSRTVTERELKTSVMNMMCHNIKTLPFDKSPRVAYRVPGLGEVCARLYGALTGLGKDSLSLLVRKVFVDNDPLHVQYHQTYKHGLEEKRGSNHALLPATRVAMVDWLLQLVDDVREFDPTQARCKMKARNGKFLCYLPAHCTTKQLHRQFNDWFKEAHEEQYLLELRRTTVADKDDKRKSKRRKLSIPEDKCDWRDVVSQSTFSEVFNHAFEVAHIKIQSLRNEI